MGDDDTNFEDVLRAIGRRWSTVLVATLVFTALGAAYGWQTTARGEFSADVSISIVPSNVVLVSSQTPPLDFTASSEAARIEADLIRLSEGREEMVSVDADAIANTLVLTGRGSTAQAATDLAMQTATKYVEERRADRRRLFDNDARFQQTQLDAVTARLDEVNARLEALDPNSQSLALEGERIQLFAKLLDLNERLAADRVNATEFDAGLTDPVLVDQPLASSSSGWVVFGIVGGFLGLMIGVGLALVSNALDHRIRSRADVERVVSRARVLGVLGRTPDDEETAALAARTRSASGGSEVAILTDGATRVPEGLSRALGDAGGEMRIVSRIDDLQSAQALVAVRAGSTTDAGLAALVADLDVRGVPLAGVVLYDVPPRDLDWARRPLLSARVEPGGA